MPLLALSALSPGYSRPAVICSFCHDGAGVRVDHRVSLPMRDIAADLKAICHTAETLYGIASARSKVAALVSIEEVDRDGVLRVRRAVLSPPD